MVFPAETFEVYGPAFLAEVYDPFKGIYVVDAFRIDHPGHFMDPLPLGTYQPGIFDWLSTENFFSYAPSASPSPDPGSTPSPGNVSEPFEPFTLVVDFVLELSDHGPYDWPLVGLDVLHIIGIAIGE